MTGKVIGNTYTHISKSHTFARYTKLIDYVTSLVQHIWHIIVFFQKVEYTQTEKVKRDTHVPVIIEPVKYQHAKIRTAGITLLYFVEDVYLKLSRFSILVNIFYDLQSYLASFITKNFE